MHRKKRVERRRYAEVCNGSIVESIVKEQRESSRNSSYSINKGQDKGKQTIECAKTIIRL